MTSVLLRNATLIDTVPAPRVIERADLLVADGRIAAVGSGLQTDAEVIDASGRIVMPGLVDTHRHTWQAGMRMMIADTTLPDYLRRVLGGIAGRHRPADVHTGNLAGALEALDSGVTTLLDWSHIQLSPAHTEATLEALRESGIRAVFGYCYGGPDGLDGLAAEGHRVHRECAASGTAMAVAALGAEIADEDRTVAEWRLARDLGVPITVHMGGHGAESAERGLDVLRRNGLLGDDVTYVHPNHYSDEALREIADSGGRASLSPVIEAALSIGYPATGRVAASGVRTSLSVDSVASSTGDMFSVMRGAYLLERARPEGAGLGFTTRDALRMATLGGAEVLGLDDEIGSLTVGRQADLIMLRADALGIAPLHDPIASVVLNADRSSVDLVMVAGRVVKRDGRLLGHDLPALLKALETTAQHIAA